MDSMVSLPFLLDAQSILVRRGFLIRGSLSTQVFETRTATGSEMFSLLTCPQTTTFTLLSILSPLETSSIKIWEKILSLHAKCSLPVAVRVSKTCVLKLTINIYICYLTSRSERSEQMRYCSTRT